MLMEEPRERLRKRKFSKQQVQALVEFVISHGAQLYGPTMSPLQERKRIWQEATRLMNRNSQTKRTSLDVQKRWQDERRRIRHLAQDLWRSLRETGVPAGRLTCLEEAVLCSMDMNNTLEQSGVPLYVQLNELREAGAIIEVKVVEPQDASSTPDSIEQVCVGNVKQEPSESGAEDSNNEEQWNYEWTMEDQNADPPLQPEPPSPPRPQPPYTPTPFPPLNHSPPPRDPLPVADTSRVERLQNVQVFYPDRRVERPQKAQVYYPVQVQCPDRGQVLCADSAQIHAPDSAARRRRLRLQKRRQEREGLSACMRRLSSESAGLRRELRGLSSSVLAVRGELVSLASAVNAIATALNGRLGDGNTWKGQETKDVQKEDHSKDSLSTDAKPVPQEG